MMRTASCLIAMAAGVAVSAPAPVHAGVQYVYDSAGRLIKAIYSNGITIEYRYDAAGNRTQIVTTNAPNTAPVANNDSSSVGAGASVDIMVRTNDTDPEGNILTVTSVSSPSDGGSVSIQGGGTHVLFTAPASGGTKTFTYTISDRAGGTASATVTVTVSSTNTPPVAVDDDASASVGTAQAIFVRTNDTDANGHNLTITSVSTPTGGSVSIASGGSYVIYTAPTSAGFYSFNYTVSDGNGGTDTATVSIEVTSGEGPSCPSGQYCEIQG